MIKSGYHLRERQKYSVSKSFVTTKPQFLAALAAAITGPTLILCAAMLAQGLYASDAPLYVFDNGLGRGVLTVEEQAELAGRTGYAGILYAGTDLIPQRLAADRARGLKLLGIYTGMNVSDAKPSYLPGLPEAIRQLKGHRCTDCLHCKWKGGERRQPCGSRHPRSGRHGSPGRIEGGNLPALWNVCCPRRGCEYACFRKPIALI